MIFALADALSMPIHATSAAAMQHQRTGNMGVEAMHAFEDGMQDLMDAVGNPPPFAFDPSAPPVPHSSLIPPPPMHTPLSTL